MFRLIYALSVADQYIKKVMYKNVLVIGSEVHSAGLDMTSRTGSFCHFLVMELGAAVLSREEELEWEFFYIYTRRSTCRRINRKGPRNGGRGN
jgi:3-oxoacyl-[acyl-carrier-protein] synthase-3